MERYDYLQAVIDDVKEYINDEIEMSDYADRDELAEYLNEHLWAHDMVTDYVERYHDHPTAKWYNRHFRFERVK